MITLVSGLPRSGTSLMMQMLAAGGMPVLDDGKGVPDESNPRGYFEWESIANVAHDPKIIDQAEGKAVKAMSAILYALPPGHEYRVIFMERPLEEVVASQRKMIERKQGKLPPDVTEEQIMFGLEQHLKQVHSYLKRCQEIKVLRVGFPELFRVSFAWSHNIVAFLGLKLDVEAMARQVDEKLYRNRSAHVSV